MTGRTPADTLYRVLVREVAARHPRFLTEPFTLADLLQHVLPYRHHRRELGFSTSEAYDLAVLELLARDDERLRVDERLRDAARAGLAKLPPDPSVIRELAQAEIALDRDALVADGVLPSGPVPVGRLTLPGGMPAVGAAMPVPTCQYCEMTLPLGRTVTFCPYCGQNLTVKHCAACGSELEVGWRYCVTCGRAASLA